VSGAAAQGEGGTVVVAGAGPVGASLALALAAAGVEVTVLEAAPIEEALPPSYDDRPLALSLGSRRVLETLGLWAGLAARASPIHTVHVSQRGGFGVTRIRAAEEGVEALGYVLAARELGETLGAALAAAPRVRLLRPARIAALERSAAALRLRLEGGDEEQALSARLLVAADGADSPLRAMLGVAVAVRDYRQRAITANVTPRREHRGWAYERFTPEGPLALLPLEGGRCGLVWALPPERAEALLEASDEAFLEALGAAFGRRLGGFERVGARSCYPLRLVRARTRARARALIIGNAAHGLHPVAGQGFNLGLRDAALLAEVVAAALRGGEDPGEARVLARYLELRRGDEAVIRTLTDTLVRLFSNDFAPLAAARGLGLLALDLAPGLRRRFAATAMYGYGRRSRLATGLAP